ncbi:hypothetical protein JW960_19100 [candidate division KSB1 bacterium]|nr:hypothetical protein [candidate division KSB1 bacterium]
MPHSLSRLLILGLLAIVLMTITLGCSGDTGDNSYSTDSASGIEKYCYTIPEAYWPKISVLGSFSSIIIFVALTFGVVIYVIGYYAGARLNKPKILGAITMATLVGLLGRSVEAYARYWLYYWLEQAIHKPVLSAIVVDVFVYTIWITFIAGISVHVYETFVVTAKEAHPM